MKIRRLGTSAAALMLAATAGCGGTGSGEASTSDGGDLTKATFASAVSDAQTKAETAHLEADMTAQGQKLSMSGDMDMSKNDVAFDLSMTGASMGGDARFILVDRVVYLRMPGLSQGDKFIKIDASKGGGPVAEMFDKMMSQLNPSQTFEAFDAITSLKEKGTQEIDGVETTHYTVTVDTQKALKAQGMADQVPSGKMPKTIDYDVWVDGDNLVRKLSMDVQGNQVDMRLSQWGESVDIAAPPKNQVTDMAEMMGRLGGSAKNGARG